MKKPKQIVKRKKLVVSEETLGKLLSGGKYDRIAKEAQEIAQGRAKIIISKSEVQPVDYLDTIGVLLSGGVRDARYSGDLEDVAKEGVEKAGECSAKISGYGGTGALAGGIAGSFIPGVGNALGALGGWIAGALAAAWECGALQWLREAAEAVVEWFKDIFNPDPPNWKVYVDVAGPSLRRTNFTLDAEKERRMLVPGMNPDTLPKEIYQTLVGQFEKRVPGTKTTWIEQRWLLRRVMELGGGSEQMTTLQRIVGMEAAPVEKSDQAYEVLKAANEKFKASLAPTDLTNSVVRQQLKFLTDLEFSALRTGGYTKAEAREKMGMPADVKDNIELSALEGLLKKYLPGTEELEERKKAEKRAPLVKVPNYTLPLQTLPAAARPALVAPGQATVPAGELVAALSQDSRVKRLGEVRTASAPFDALRDQDSGGGAGALIALAAVGAFLLLRK